MLISAPSNDRVKALRKLHRGRGRRDSGLTLLEGPNLVHAAQRAGVDLVEIWSTDDDGDVQMSAAVLAALSTTESPQSPIGVLRLPEPERLRSEDTVVLWGVSDPGNAGTIIRTAAALNWDIAVGPGTVDVWAPKVLRAGAGGHFTTHLARLESVGDATAAGLVTLASVIRVGGTLQQGGGQPVALFVGSEPHGLPDDVIEACDKRVSLEMPGGMESLNAAVAAAILMWGRQHTW